MIELNPDISRSIICEMAKGMPYNVVAEAHGIREKTLQAWIHEGIEDAERKLPTLKADFATGLRKAELRFINRSMLAIRKNPKAWKNHAWVLEHAYPRYYGSNTIELESIHKQLLELKEFVQGQNDLKVLHKPVVQLVDDEVNCSNDTQGDDNHGKS